MAAFKQHVLFSTALGGAYGVLMSQIGIEPAHAALGGTLCAASGMLPDLDSDSGRPVQEIFGATAAILPMLMCQRLAELGLSPEGTILFMVGMYLFVRFGLAWIFKSITVHRGMFHSLPAAVIASEVVYLAHECRDHHGQWVLAGGVLLGFLSHLVLDEIYSVDASGLVPRLKSSAGSAVKLFSQSIPATLATWVLLTGLTYVIAVREGYLKSPQFDWRGTFQAFVER